MLTRTTSAILSRRANSLTLRIRGVGASIQSESESCNGISPQLPLEVVEAVVGFVLLSHPSPEARFLAINSFTCASKPFREISLRLYFRDIIIDTRALFARVWNYLNYQNRVFGCSNSFGWVRCLDSSVDVYTYSMALMRTIPLRSLVGSSHIITHADKTIGSFIRLESLNICFVTEGLRTQDSVVERLVNAFTYSGRANLKNLALSNVPRIDTRLLRSLSAAFPYLKTLALESTRRIDHDCCVPCLEDSLEHTRHSPIPDYYSNAEKLATSFAQCLAPMTRLENLYFGLYLSDTIIIEDHIAHTDDIHGGTGVLRLFPSCVACGRFREETQRREKLVSMALSKALPSLATIRWDSLFNPSGNEGSRVMEYDKDGFYFSSEDITKESQVPFAATFAIHRDPGTGEVREISPLLA